MAAAARVKVFTVAPTDPYGWTIRLESSAQSPHFFANRQLAINYARLWAKANRPSILQSWRQMARLRASGATSRSIRCTPEPPDDLPVPGSDRLAGGA